MDDEDEIRNDAASFPLPQLPLNTGFKYLHYHPKEDVEQTIPLPLLPVNNHSSNVSNDIAKVNGNNNVSPDVSMLITDNGSHAICDNNDSTACNNVNLSLVNGSATNILAPSAESVASPAAIDSTNEPTPESTNQIDEQSIFAEEWRTQTRSSISDLKRKLSETLTESSVGITSISTAGQTFDDETTLSAPASPKQCKLSHQTSSCDEYEAMKQHRPSVMGNSVQSGGLKSFLNPEEFKNSDEIKHFLKHQLQFSDLGKLFGNIDFSSVGPGHLNDYAQFLGLQPTVKFKCFKCADSTFESLAKLKEHQSVCLLQRNLEATSETATSDVLEANPSPNTDTSNQLDEEMTQPKSTPSTEDSAIPASPSTIENSNCIDTKFRITRKVYLCSACGTYYENWNLFHHMREVHKKFICLLCLGIFPSAEKLVHHLEGKHATKPDIYEHKEQLLQAIRDQCYLMCSVCEHIFSEHDDFTSHSCENYIQACGLCGLKFIHKPNCRAGVPLGGFNNQAQRANNNNGARQRIRDNKQKTKHKQRKQPTNQLADQSDSNNHDQSFPTNGFDSSEHHELPPPLLQLTGQINATESTSIVQSSSSVQPEQKWREELQNLEKLQSDLCFGTINRNDKTINNNHHQQSARSVTPPNTSQSNKNNSFFRQPNSLNADDYLENPYMKQTSEELGTSSVSNRCQSPLLKPTEPANTFTVSSPTILNESTSDRPLLVPKLKLKISKEFQTPLESEESTTESDEEDESVDDEEDDDEDYSNRTNFRSATQSGPTALQLMAAELSQSPSHRTESINNISDRGSVHMDIEYNSSIAEDREEDEPAIQGDANDEEDEDVNIEEIDETKPSNLVPINVLPPPQMSPSSDHIAQSPEQPTEPSDGIALAGEDETLLELILNQPLDCIPIRQLLRTCLKASYSLCLYCNHARKIAVDGNSLALHLLAHHRFAATVDSITAEELQPSTIIQRMKSSLEELNGCFFNLDSYDNCDPTFTIPYEKSYECFQCRFYARIHKDLYLHNRKMHLKSVLLCLMCRSNFYSYSELVCHMCPGANSKLVLFELKFRCVLCQLDGIPSAFRLMVHLRKKHFACDVCLEECTDQSKLSSHVWKHKLHHLCYRCGIAYRNKPDITKHLFWKHGTESVVCKKCLQKKWPHVYHFCIPPSTFICEVCNLTFSRAVALKVHKRLHSDDHPYPCTEDDCEKKFISRKLLLKHVARHNAAVAEAAAAEAAELEKPPAPVNVIEEIKEEAKVAIKLEPPEPMDETSSKEESKIASDAPKKKSKKQRKHKNSPVTEVAKNIIDIIDLPAPNLSESDSSDESDNEKASSSMALIPPPPPAFEVAPAMDIIVDPTTTANDEDKPTPIVDIWDNFKSYQASQPKPQYSDDEQEHSPMPPAILHVSQSDHDYCAMYKPVNTKVLKKEEAPEVEAMNELESILVEAVKQDMPDQVQEILSTRQLTPPPPPKHKHTSPKKGRSPKKALLKSGSESSSDSSDSDSSCSCGSNCSCSTSSSGSSSSSSSSDDSSDSSSAEGRRKQQIKRTEKQEKRKRNKSETSLKDNLSDNIDVVTTEPVHSDPPMFANKTDPDLIIFESDLETDESETDEEFYDEHPQRLATQLLAEKRKQLMLQTCMNPLNNYDIVENSRPSTPSLPEEMVKSKKVKVKKRKKDRKNSTKSVPSLKLNIPLKMSMLAATPKDTVTEHIPDPEPTLLLPPIQPLQPPPLQVPPISLNFDQHKYQAGGSSILGTPNVPGNIKYNQKPRLSTGSSCSDADAPLKRSKRRRIPNKFYGYTSDEEGGGGFAGSTSIIDAFKPTPPPNLTWCKEDLPQTPTIGRPPPLKTVIKLPPSLNFTRTPSDYRSSPFFNLSPAPSPPPPARPVVVPTPPPAIVSQPPIPPIIIRPNRIIQPPRVEPLRVPAVPVHHIVPPSSLLSNDTEQSSESSDSDTSEEGALQISQPMPVIHAPPPPPPVLTPAPQPLSATRMPARTPARAPVARTPASNKAKINKSRLQVQHQYKPATPAIPLALQFPLASVASSIRYPIMPPAGCRPAREGESVYCYCRCPYDEVSEMIACDGSNCAIEWFHFECVNIMVPPKGTWYCPQCRPNYIDDSKLQDDMP